MNSTVIMDNLIKDVANLSLKDEQKINLLDLPNDILKYIHKLEKTSRIDELKKKYRIILNEKIIQDLRFYEIIEDYIYNIDIEHIIYDADKNFEEFKKISFMNMHYIIKNTNKGFIQELYNIKCEIKKLNGQKKITYKDFKHYLYNKLFDVFEQRLLYNSYLYLHEFKHKIKNYLNDYIEYEHEITRKIAVAKYFTKIYLCKNNKYYTNGFIIYLEKNPDIP